MLGIVFALSWTLRAQPPQQPEAFATGLRFAPQDEYRALPLASTPLMGLLPPRVDLSSAFPAPHAAGQGKQGSCVGWAIAYALKSYLERVERHWEFSDTTVFSPAYIYNSAKEPGTCTVGTYYTKALKFVQENGAARWSAFPYDVGDCARAASSEERQQALPFRIASYATVNTTDITEVKAHVASGEPVLIGMWVDREFQNLCSNCVYQGVRSNPLGGHALVVVGYDDDKGAFKIINSWGSLWATAGYGWMSYTAFSDTSPRTVVEGYVVTDAQETQPIASPAPGAAMDYEVVSRQYEPAGIRTAVPIVTEDRHCSSNCSGEPTRKNYVASLIADEGTMLRNPKLICHGTACPWSGVVFVRLEQSDRKAVGSWDVWGRPTTWELSAEQVKIVETRRMSARAGRGTDIEVVGEEGAPPPIILWTAPDGTRHRYEPGRDVPPGIAYLGRREVGGVPTFKVRFGS
jgi:hypothetical protein